MLQVGPLGEMGGQIGAHASDSDAADPESYGWLRAEEGRHQGMSRKVRHLQLALLCIKSQDKELRP